ncbi:MAG: hypothetical protein ABIH23_14555, partial [bacterium]
MITREEVQRWKASKQPQTGLITRESVQAWKAKRQGMGVSEPQASLSQAAPAALPIRTPFNRDLEPESQVSTTYTAPDFNEPRKPRDYRLVPGLTEKLFGPPQERLTAENRPEVPRAGRFLANAALGVSDFARVPFQAVEDPVGMVPGLVKFPWESLIKPAMEGMFKPLLGPLGMPQDEAEAEAAQKTLEHHPLEAIAAAGMVGKIPLPRRGRTSPTEPVATNVPKAAPKGAPEKGTNVPELSTRPPAEEAQVAKAQEGQKAQEVGKEPWEMTRGEWDNRVTVAFREGKQSQPPEITQAVRDTHKTHVQQALSEGKSVSPKVLADYPDLRPVRHTAQTVPAQMGRKAPVAPVGETSAKAKRIAKSIPLVELRKRNPEYIDQISNPDGTITVYRNTGLGGSTQIEPNDYVSIRKGYARGLRAGGAVVSAKIPIEDLRLSTGMDATVKGELFYVPRDGMAAPAQMGTKAPTLQEYIKEQSSLSPRDVEILTQLRDSKSLPGEIYVKPERLGISAKELRDLRKGELIDPGTPTLSIEGRLELLKAEGVDPWEGLSNSFTKAYNAKYPPAQMGRKAPVAPVGETLPPKAPGAAKAPKAAPAKAEKAETAKAEPDVIGLKRAETDRLRQELELEPATPVKKRAWQRASDDADALGLVDRAPEVANDVLKTGRAMTDSEYAGLVRKVDALDKERMSLVDKAVELQDAGDVRGAEGARSRAREILDQQEHLMDASDKSGTGGARGMSIRRAMLNRESLRLVDVVRQARAAKGATLTVEENAHLNKITKEARDAVKAYEEELATTKAKLAESERLLAERIATREVKKATITRKAAGRREKILAERADIKKKIEAMGYRVNDITGVSAEGSYLVGRLAVNYIKEGAVNLNEVVQKVLADLPDLTEQDVWRALNARNPRLQKRARSVAVRRVNELKTQARLLVDLEKAETGVFEARPGIPKNKSAEIRGLQKQLRELRNAAYKAGNTEMQSGLLERTINKINEVQDQLENYYRAIKKKQTIPSADVQAARQKLAEIRKAMRTEDALSDLQEQMRTNQFRIPEKPIQKQLPPQLERRQVELKMARQKVRGAIREMTPKGKGPKRWLDETASFTRAAKATADMSGTLRQGLVLVAAQPGKAMLNFGRTFKATFSKYEAAKIDNAIRSVEHQWVRDRAG